MRVVASQSPKVQVPTVKAGRRDMLLSVGGAAAMTLFANRPALAANSSASATLPAASEAGYYVYQPGKDATPMLRAGVMQQPPYSFNLAGDFSPDRIPNPETGGFCAPKCGEPWKEASFAADKYGRIEVLGIPLVKFTFEKGVSIEKLGTPDALLDGLGPYLTGSSFDRDEVEVITATSRKGADGLTYYDYYIFSDYVVKGQGGRVLATATVRGDVLTMMKASATDKQFKTSEAVLRKSLESFRA